MATQLPMTRVLIVEDNEMNRDMLARRLTRKGFDVLLAVDAAAGIADTRQHQPDLVLMDMSLPDMTGAEAARVLKADHTTRSIPIIALTAHATDSARHEALTGGCDDFETKPIDLDHLLAKMQALISRAGRRWTSAATPPAPGAHAG